MVLRTSESWVCASLEFLQRSRTCLYKRSEIPPFIAPGIFEEDLAET